MSLVLSWSSKRSGLKGLKDIETLFFNNKDELSNWRDKLQSAAVPAEKHFFIESSSSFNPSFLKEAFYYDNDNIIVDELIDAIR